MAGILRMAQPYRMILIVLASCCLCQCAAAHPFAPRAPYRLATVRSEGLAEGPDLVSRCTEKWHNTTLDHYTWVSPTISRPGRGCMAAGSVPIDGLPY
jgi:hypothetical protein